MKTTDGLLSLAAVKLSNQPLPTVSHNYHYETKLFVL